MVEFEAEDATEGRCLPADYNVAPTKEVHAVLLRHGVRQLRVLCWGLVPSWAPDTSGAARLINARAETAADRPAFRSALRRRRCLIPADGWYEWAPSSDRPGRQPYFIAPSDGSGLALAGLYEVRDHLLTCTIITAEAAGPLAQVHDRMPVVVGRESWARWLDPALTDVAEVGDLTQALTSAAPVDELELRPVGRAVGNVDSNGPELLQPEVLAEPQTLF